MEFSRRALLTAAGAGVAGTAGCLDFAAGDGPQGPEGTPASLECSDEGFERFDPPFDDDAVQYVTARTPDGHRFELAAQGTQQSYGNELRVTLRNLSDAEIEIGPKELVSIQRRTEAGWQEVRGADGAIPAFPDEVRTVGSGGGYAWSVRLREPEIAALGPEGLRVCPALGPGVHRFVFWGLPGDAAAGREFQIIG
ncbi:hypothetical protein GCM10027435_04870 [Haloparvum alkalitolerans]|uniref:hypothetical protein n=1 Tax=Haloparvum alkalitolerans TaxID=1042953 RepID=UPI003CFA1C0F